VVFVSAGEAAVWSVGCEAAGLMAADPCVRVSGKPGAFCVEPVAIAELGPRREHCATHREALFIARQWVGEMARLYAWRIGIVDLARR
jgi:hypothetical protein